GLIRFAEDRPSMGGSAAAYACAAALGLLQRHAAQRRAGVGLNGRLTLGIAAPPDLDKAQPGTVGHQLTELIVAACAIGAAEAEGQCLVVEPALYLCEQLRHPPGDTVFSAGLLGGAVRARHQNDLTALGVARPDLDADGHALELPVVVLETGALLAPVGLHAH